MVKSIVMIKCLCYPRDKKRSKRSVKIKMSKINKNGIVFASAFLAVLSSVLINATSVSALDSGGWNPCSNASNCNTFTLEAIRCDSNTYDLTTDDGFTACYDDYMEADDPDSYPYRIGPNDKINADTYILFLLNLTPTDTAANNLVKANIRIDWDPNVIIMPETDLGDPYYWDISSYPKTKKASYSLDATNKPFEGTLIWQVDGQSVGTPLNNEIQIGYFMLKTLSEVPGGSQTTVAFNDANAGTFDLSSTTSGTHLPHNSNSFTLNFAGEEKSTDATLSSLTVSKTDGSVTYPLSPEFSQSAAPQTVFSTKVPSSVSQIKISATANNDKVQDIKLFDGNVQDTVSGGTSIKQSTIPVVGVGTKTVTTGTNEFTIAVTSENGNIQNEVVSIYKLSNDSTLSDLVVTGGTTMSPSFSPATTSYTMDNVPYSTKSLNIAATTNHANATRTGQGTFALSPDTTAAKTYTRQIVVSPEECQYTSGANKVTGASCVTKTYTITVNREAASTDANLKSLSATYVHTTGSSAATDSLITSSEAGKTIDLNEVPYAATSIDFSATANQAKAKKMTISVNGGSETTISTSGSPISGNTTCNLAVGDNTCVIKVTAEDNSTTQTYTIKAYRRSNDASLKTLTVTSVPASSTPGLSPSFPSSSNDTYNFVYSEKAASYAVSATVNDTGKTQSIVMAGNNPNTKTETGNSITDSFTPSGNISPADQVTIVVTAEDGNTRTYTINLKREASSDASLSSIKVTTSNGTTSEEHSITPTANNYDYSIEVEPDVSTITNVTATPTSSHASIASGDITYNSDLNFGSNTVTIKATPEQGNKSQYNITVVRKKYNIAGASKIEVRYGSDANWTEVENVSPNADGTFDLRVKDVNPVPFDTGTMAFRVTKAEEHAAVTGDGSKSLVSNKNNQFVITVKSQDESVTRTYTFNVYREGDPNTGLTSLVIAGQTPTTVDETHFTVTVPFTKTQITESDIAVVTQSSVASVTKSGTLGINAGETKDYPFTVTAQSGASRTYHIAITRLQNDQAGASQITLRLSDESQGTRNWIPSGSQTTYTFEIPYNKSQYYLEAVIPDGAIRVSEDPYVDSDDLLTIDNSGTSTHKIKIRSQDGSNEVEYTITVNRALSTDNTLSDLNLTYTEGDGTAHTKQTVTGFLPSKKSYNISVPGDVDSITVGATLNDSRAKFVETNSNAEYSHNYSLNYDLNEITVETKAESGALETYTLNITRQRKTNPYIQSITINGQPLNNFLSGTTYDGNQASGTFDYTLTKFPNSTSQITIDAVMVDADDAHAEINSSKLFPQNVALNTIHYGGAQNAENKIEFYGVAHDGTKKLYRLHVYRDASNDARVSEDADAVQVYWGGTWHNATWDPSEEAFTITVPNSVTTASSENVQAKPRTPCTGCNAGTVAMDPQKTLVTNDPTYGNVNEYGFTITAEDGTTTRPYYIKITREKSDDASLKALSVNNDQGTSIGSFNPSFAADKYSYTVTVGKDVSEVYIDAEANEGHANISGEGRKEIDGVDDVFTIEVIPENGDTTKKKTYTLNIVREKSDDATLSEFKVTNLNGEAYTITPTFNPSDSTTLYQVSIPGDEDRVLLEYVGSQNLAEGVTQTIAYTVTPDNAPDEYNIPTGGERTLGVKVTAENGTTEKTYSVKVTRTKRNNALLDTLTYTFNGGTTQSVNLENCTLDDGEYTCDLGQLASSGASGMTLGATAKDDQATITGDVSTPLTISTGRNSYQITVKAEDGTTEQVYNITLLKKPSEEGSLSNMYVKDASNLDPAFSAGTYSYTVTMNDEDKDKLYASDIVATRASNKATAEMSEPIDLIVNQDNWYTITIKPEACDDKYADLVAAGVVNCNDNIKTYYINAQRKPSSNSFLYNAEVDSGTRMSPTFSKTGFNYNITIPYGGNSFEITAEPERTTSIVTDNAGHTFTSANNYKQRVYYNDLTNGAYRITVTPQSGENPRYYNFTVSIAQSSDSTLASLQVWKDGNQVALTPAFDAGQLAYSIPDITNDVTELTVMATENNPDATYRYIYQNNEVCRETGSCKITIDPSKTMQTIKVEVTPADQSEPSVYRIDFNIKKDNNANLATLSVGTPGTLNRSFDPGTTDYSVNGLTYENVSAPVVLKYTVSDPDARVSINGGAEKTGGTVEWTENLNFDTTDKKQQTIVTTIKVIAEDNSSKTYTVTAVRAAAIASNDPTLAVLSVTGETLSPSFAVDHEPYDIGEIAYSKESIEVNVQPNNEEARVFINGDEVAISGGVGSATVAAPQTNDEQTVTIRVLAGNNVDEKTYTIKFHKNGSSDTTLSQMEFTNGTLNEDYSPGIKNYTLTLGEDQTTGIIVTPNDPNATVSFGTTDNMKILDPGIEMGVTGLTETVNTRKLLIMAQDGTIEDITITIVRTTGEDRITSLAYGHEITARNVTVDGEVAKYGYIMSVADRNIGERAADGTYPDYDNSPSGTMTVELLANQLDNQRVNLHFYRPNLDENGIFIGKGDEITSDEVIGTGTVVTLEVDNVLKDQVIVIIKGEVNGDGVINYKDRGKIINHNAADGTKFAEGSLGIIAADIDSDGIINYKDRGKVINHTAADGTRINYGAMLNPAGGGAPPGS